MLNSPHLPADSSHVAVQLVLSTMGPPPGEPGLLIVTALLFEHAIFSPCAAFICYSADMLLLWGMSTVASGLPAWGQLLLSPIGGPVPCVWHLGVPILVMLLGFMACSSTPAGSCCSCGCPTSSVLSWSPVLSEPVC